MSRTILFTSAIGLLLIAASSGFAQQIRRDAYGDPLPQHAICRIGTTRLYHPFLQALAFSPNGKLLVTVGELSNQVTYTSSGIIRLWEIPSGKLIGEMESPAECSTVAFAPNGDHVATGDSDATVRLWNITTGKLAREFKLAAADAAELDVKSPVSNVLFSADGKLLAARDYESIFIWDAATGKQTQTLGVRNLKPFSFAEDAKSLLAVQDKRHLVKYDVASGEQQYSVEAASPDEKNAEFPSLGIVVADLSPDGKQIATFAEGEGRIRVWETATGKPLADVKDAPVLGPMQFTPDGEAIQAVLEDGGIHRFRGDQRETLRQPRKLILGELAFHAPRDFSPDGRLLAEMDLSLLGANGRVELWDVEKNAPAANFRPPGALIRLSHDGAKLIAHGGGDFSVWDADRGEVLVRFGPSKDVREYEKRYEEIAIGAEGALVRRAGFSPDGKTAIAARGALMAVSTDDGTQSTLISMGDFGSYIYEARLSPDGVFVAMFGASEDVPGVIKLFNRRTGRFVQTLRVTGAIDFTFSPDSNHLATYNAEKQRVRLWNTATGRLDREVPLRVDDPPIELKMTPKAFVLQTQQRIFAFDLSGRNRREFTGQDANTMMIDVSSEGRYLAATQATGKVRIWDLAAGKLLKEFHAHGELHMIGDVSFSADGKRLATSDLSGQEVLVWDLEALLADGR